MSNISDNDLILFHYHDGLPSERLREIEQALATSPALAARYRTLRRLLAGVDCDLPPQPDTQFENRLWTRLHPRLNAPIAAAPLPRLASRHGARPRRRLWAVGLASGAGLAAAVLAVALYFPVAHIDAPLQPAPAQRAAAQGPMADRVLAVYVATHLRKTEGLLLSVVNSDSTTLMPADEAFVRALADDNRLYASAAAKRGDKVLAGFLKTLDPVLIELANQQRVGNIPPDQGLRDFVRDSDLLFQVRAVEARLQARRTASAQTGGAMT